MISTSSEGEGQHKSMHNDNTSNVSYVLFSEVRHFPKYDESLIVFFIFVHISVYVRMTLI